MIEVLHILLQRCRSALGQTDVVVVGTFGRGETFDEYGGDGYVLVAAHGVDGAGDFAQFGGVGHIVGVKLCPVHGEVDESRAFELEFLDAAVERVT